KALETAEKEVRELVEADAKQLNEYEINGVVVHMTTPQASRWNSAETTDEDLDSIKVCVPTTEGAGSYVRDGEVVMVQGMPATKWITMRESLADADLAGLLENAEAEFSHGPVS